MHPGYDNPRVTLTTSRPYGSPPACIACQRPVDTDDDYLALVTGTTRRADLLAVAHPEIWTGPGDNDWDSTCADILKDRWQLELHQAKAATLQRGCDAGGQRCYLGDEPLHAGTPLDLLAADGHWHHGRFEYQATKDGLVPRFHLAIAGWTTQDAAITLPPTAVLRETPR